MDIEYDSLTVRPPWFDEIPRFKSFFRDDPLPGPSCRLFALVAPRPERIVGVGALKAAGQLGELRLRLRPRVQSEGRGAPLLTAALGCARTLGLKRIIARPPAGSPQEIFLREHGFVELETEEVWRVDLETLKKRLEPFSGRRSKPGWIIRAPEEKDLPDLAVLVHSRGLPNPGQLRQQQSAPAAGEKPLGFDPTISSIVHSSGRVLAALLGEGSPGLDCRATLCVAAQDALCPSSLLCVTVLSRSVSEALRQGWVTASFVLNPTRHVAVRNLARRSGATLLKTICTLALDL